MPELLERAPQSIDPTGVAATPGVFQSESAVERGGRVIPITRAGTNSLPSVEVPQPMPAELTPAGVTVNRSFESQRSGGPLFPPVRPVERPASYPPPLSPQGQALKMTTDEVIGKGLVGQPMTWPEPPIPSLPAPIEAWLPLSKQNEPPVDLIPYEPQRQNNTLTAAENDAALARVSVAENRLDGSLNPVAHEPQPQPEPTRIEQVLTFINALTDTVTTSAGQTVSRRRYEAVRHADETGAAVISVYRWDEGHQGGTGEPLTTEQFNQELVSHGEFTELTARIQGQEFVREMKHQTETTRTVWQRSELARRYDDEIAQAATAAPQSIWDRIRTTITPMALTARRAAASAIAEARGVGVELQRLVETAHTSYRQATPSIEQQADAAIEVQLKVPERDVTLAAERRDFFTSRFGRVTSALTRLLGQRSNPVQSSLGGESTSADREVAA